MKSVKRNLILLIAYNSYFKTKLVQKIRFIKTYFYIYNINFSSRNFIKISFKDLYFNLSY